MLFLITAVGSEIIPSETKQNASLWNRWGKPKLLGQEGEGRREWGACFLQNHHPKTLEKPRYKWLCPPTSRSAPHGGKLKWNKEWETEMPVTMTTPWGRQVRATSSNFTERERFFKHHFLKILFVQITRATKCCWKRSLTLYSNHTTWEKWIQVFRTNLINHEICHSIYCRVWSHSSNLFSLQVIIFLIRNLSSQLVKTHSSVIFYDSLQVIFPTEMSPVRGCSRLEGLWWGDYGMFRSDKRTAMRGLEW